MSSNYVIVILTNGFRSYIIQTNCFVKYTDTAVLLRNTIQNKILEC